MLALLKQITVGMQQYFATTATPLLLNLTSTAAEEVAREVENLKKPHCLLSTAMKKL